MLVKYTLRCDTTLKGSVGLQDYNTVLANFNSAQGWRGGNFDNSGVVGLSDYNNVLANFNLAASGNGATSSAVASDAVGPVSPVTRTARLAASASSAGLSSDMRLQVNLTTGAVSLLAQTAVAFTGYNIVDPAHHLLCGSDIAPEKLISATNNKWGFIQDDNIALAEGQNKGAYKSTKSTSWDTIQLTAGQMIQFGNIYDTVNSVQDLTFQFSEANTTTGDPTTGVTFTLGGEGVDYLGGGQVPEPGSVSLLAIGAMGLLSRRRRRAAAKA